jgi:hypothetical protein
VASTSAGLGIDQHGGVTSCSDWGDVAYLRLEAPSPDDSPGWSSPSAAAAGDKYPHLRAAGYTCLRVPEHADVRQLLKCQLAVTARRDGVLQDATSVQPHGAVDDLFGRYDGPLGVEIRRGESSLKGARQLSVIPKPITLNLKPYTLRPTPYTLNPNS